MFTVLLTCLGIFLLEANSVETGITPDFAVRLNNSLGSTYQEGRLEIYYSGMWGTVCGDYFTNVSAKVACASLGFVYGQVIGNRYGNGTGRIWLDDVNCTGTERSIEQCPHSRWGVHKCSHSEDVSITCACGSRYFSASTGTISSPNFPNAYANYLDCYNYISVRHGFAVVLKFLAFNTESGYDWVTITCESGNAFKSAQYSGLEFPPVLTLSSCQRVNVAFHTDGSATRTGFSLTYNITSDIVIGGITTKPSNVFPNSDKNDRLIFNCTSASKYLPWWTINGKATGNYTITNSSCGVITSASYSYWFITETLGPGSCNLIIIARGIELHRLAGSLVCIDSTLASATALLVPINLVLNVMKVTNSSTKATNVVKDEDVRMSCTPSFFEYNSGPSLVFTYAVYNGGPFIHIRILRTIWTSQGNVVSSINTSDASSYVLVKATTGVIPPYTCNIVFDFFPSISSILDSFEISDSTDPINVLYWPTEENMTIIGHSDGQIISSSLLFCHVPANPPAMYQWIDESRGYITNGPTITIIHGGKYTCNASNFIRGKYYQQLKSINVEVIEDDTHRLKIFAIILGVAVLIIIILAILLIRKCRQQKTTTTSDVGHIKHGDEHELQQGRICNQYEASVDDDEVEYENLNDSRRPLPRIPAIYEELGNQK